MQRLSTAVQLDIETARHIFGVDPGRRREPFEVRRVLGMAQRKLPDRFHDRRRPATANRHSRLDDEGSVREVEQTLGLVVEMKSHSVCSVALELIAKCRAFTAARKVE